MKSEWPELAALSVTDRADAMNRAADAIKDELCILGSVCLCDLDTIAIVQQHLDRIKALVMSRKDNEKS